MAVVLHGHVRTTMDIDVFVPRDAAPTARALREHGFAFNARRKEFVKHGVPVHLVTPEQAGTDSVHVAEIDGIRVAALADLVAMKLRSGLDDVLRAQDLADVIGLIRARRLTGTFAGKLDRSLRGPFKKLARAVRDRPL